MRISFLIGRKTILVGIVALVVVAGAAWKGMAVYTTQSSFCGGSCHAMTEQYESWKISRHVAQNNDKGAQADCVDCHSLPGEQSTLKAKLRGLRHLAAYLYDPDAHLPIRPVVQDGSCLRAGCHVKTEFQDKQIKFTDKTVFKHKPHFEKAAPEGQSLSCDDCHIKHSAKAHFEVPKEICFTCHFKRDVPGTADPKQGQGALIAVGFERGLGTTIQFNKGANKCSLCHAIPTKSLQGQLSTDDPSKKPVTHQTLEKAGVPCEGCHLQEVDGVEKIKTDECLDCHNSSKELFAKGKDGRLMHDRHVATRRADCLDCHQPISHGTKKDYLDSARTACTNCHDDQHRYQKILLAGLPVSEHISPIAGLMHDVKTNCTACHIKKKHANGQVVMSGSGEACTRCHTPEHSKMLDEWQSTIEREVRVAAEAETEALEALKAADGKLDAAKLNKAKEMIAAGRELLNVVRVGNGVHNRKYSIVILDEAITSFEDSTDILKAGR